MSRRKFIHDLSKLKTTAEHRRKRSSKPWNFFHKKIYYIGDIITESDKKIKDKRVLEEIFKQQLVSLITALEVYLREMFISIIDEKKIKSDDLLKKIKKDYNLYEIIVLHEEMVNNKWKKSEVLANEYNFQSLKEVQRIFSKLLGVDVFASLKKFQIPSSDNGVFQLKRDFDKRLEEILNLRHSIVHDINFRRKISYNNIIDTWNDIHSFVDVFHAWIENRLSRWK